MVKILNCYLYAKKVMALCLNVQFFLANPVLHILMRVLKRIHKMRDLHLTLIEIFI